MLIEKEFIQSFFNHYKDKPIMEYLLNILLVYENKRPAFLIETANSQFNTTYWLPINYLIKILKLNKSEIFSIPEYPRYLIYKSIDKLPESDIELGYLLGMTYLNDNYSDFRLYRTIYKIYETYNNFELYVEIALDNHNLVIKNNIDKLKEFNYIINKYKLPYRLACKKEYDHGTIKRYNELFNKNYNYVIKYKNEYINDILNWNEEIDYLNNVEFDATVNFLNKNYDKLIKFYNKINQY